MTDLEALAKLATDATLGPWYADIDPPEDPVVWGPTGEWIANVGKWGTNATPDIVACADAMFVAAASPDVVAVGGTTLNTATNARGWTETAWSGA